MTVLLVPGTPGTTLYAGLPTPSVGGLITTLSLVNTSGSTQAANFVAPMFGVPLKKGDIPDGQYPTFELEDGTPCPATVFANTAWTDDSMSWCGALVRVPDTVAGSGSKVINVKSTSSAPAASSRSLSDLTAADMKVEVTGVTNLTGTWVASLNDAITANDNVVVWGDGPAGKIWIIGGPFKQGGTPHGQLYCWHMLIAGQDNAGGFMGLRYLGRVALPNADVTSPTATSLVVNAVLKSGSTTIRTLQGYTVGGGTLGADIRNPHYGSFFTCGTDGKWDYVQGGGSASADNTVRVTHDMSYVRQTKWSPPVNIGLSGVADAGVVNYYPGGEGGVSQNMIAGGGRPDIGVWPAWAVRHMMKQSANTERYLRAAALASGGWRFCTRKVATRELVPVADIEASYPVLGATQPTWRKLDGAAEISGFVEPTANDSAWAEDTGHMPAPHMPAYLFTAEPQYYQMLMENAFARLANCFTGTSVERVTDPVLRADGYTSAGYTGERTTQIGPSGPVFKGSGNLFVASGLRIAAWGVRDIATASALAQYPHKQFLQSVTENIFGAGAAYAAAMPASFQDAGFFWRRGTDGSHEAPWMSNFLVMTTCYAADITEIAAASTFRSHLGKFHEAWVDAGYSPTLLNAFIYPQWTDTELCNDIAEAVAQTTIDLVFSSSTSQISASYAFTNGSAFAFSSSMEGGALPPFTGAASDRRYYVVNASGTNAQLSLTRGGAPITFTGSATINRYFTNEQTIPNNSPVNPNYAAILSATLRWLTADGVPVASALAESEDINTVLPVDFTGAEDLAFAMVATR